MAGKPTEIGIQRTAPEAAALVVQRTVDGSGRRGEPVPGARRHMAVGVAMLGTGLVATFAAIAALGSRIGPTAEAVRDTELDATAVFFLGTSGSVAELVLAIVLLLLIPVGIVLAVVGYRRVTDDGPSVAAVHVSNAPNAIINRFTSHLG